MASAAAISRKPDGARLALGAAYWLFVIYLFAPLTLMVAMSFKDANFIAFPITLGIGVDYAINVVHRWRLDGPGRVWAIVHETGGAVVLCSLTTSLGYLALLQSVNSAVRSFGAAAVIGEVACLLAVVVVLPAVLSLLERRPRGPHSSQSTGELAEAE